MSTTNTTERSQSAVAFLRHCAANRFSPASLAAAGLGVALLIIEGVSLGHGIGGLSYWKDELFSVYWPKLGLVFMWTDGLWIETNPPLYYTLVYAFASFSGYGEAGPRLISLAMLVASVGITYAIARKLFDGKVALLSAAAIGLSPCALYYAAEARMYTLLVFFVALAMLGAIGVVSQARVEGTSGARWSILGYSAGSVGAAYSHMTGMIAMYVLAVSLAVHLTRSSKNRLLCTQFYIATACITVITAPVGFSALLQAHSANLAWIHPPTTILALEALATILVGPGAVQFNATWSAVLAAAIVSAVLYGLRYTSLDDRARLLLVRLPVAFVLVLFAVSVFRPILIPRVLIWELVPISVLASHVALTAPPKVRYVIIGLWSAAAFGGQIAFLNQGWELKEDWKAMANDLRAEISLADVLVVGPRTTPLGLVFYAADPPIGHIRRWVPPEGIPDNAENFLAAILFGVEPITTAGLVDVVRNGNRVFSVMDAGDHHSFEAAVLPAMPRPPSLFGPDYQSLSVLRW